MMGMNFIIFSSHNYRFIAWDEKVLSFLQKLKFSNSNTVYSYVTYVYNNFVPDHGSFEKTKLPSWFRII
jgi:hypothetical protein